MMFPGAIMTASPSRIPVSLRGSSGWSCCPWNVMKTLTYKIKGMNYESRGIILFFQRGISERW